LLTDKFKLFSSVFGASDEVLGAIEDGHDFEKSISDILTRCRTSEELDAAFQALGDKYAAQISQEMESAKSKVFDNLDPHVSDKLKAYDAESGQALNTFERLLLAITKHELEPFATFDGDGRSFTLNRLPSNKLPLVEEAEGRLETAPPSVEEQSVSKPRQAEVAYYLETTAIHPSVEALETTALGKYYFKSHPQQGARQYRYSSPLAKWVVTNAEGHPTPPAELTFSLSQSERVPTALKAMAGTSGILTANLLTFKMKAESRPSAGRPSMLADEEPYSGLSKPRTEQIVESYMLSGAITDDGDWLDAEYVSDILNLTCVTQNLWPPSPVVELPSVGRPNLSADEALETTTPYPLVEECPSVEGGKPAIRANLSVEEPHSGVSKPRDTPKPRITPEQADALFAPYLKEQSENLEREVQSRNARYYAEQEELLYRNTQDRKAEHEGAIREYRAKEKEARKQARLTDDPMQQLRFKREARRWEQKAEDADEDFREARKLLRAEADEYLDLIEQSLKGTHTTDHLFTIRYRILQ
jgi:hypothetical protein